MNPLRMSIEAIRVETFIAWVAVVIKDRLTILSCKVQHTSESVAELNDELPQLNRPIFGVNGTYVLMGQLHSGATYQTRPESLSRGRH